MKKPKKKPVKKLTRTEMLAREHKAMQHNVSEIMEALHVIRTSVEDVRDAQRTIAHVLAPVINDLRTHELPTDPKDLSVIERLINGARRYV